MTVNYSPVGDLVSVSVCFVMLILMFFSYNRHTRNFRIFLELIGLLIGAAFCNITMNMLGAMNDPAVGNYILLLRTLYHTLLFTIFIMFIVYITEAARLKKRERLPFNWAAGIIWLVVFIIDVAETVMYWNAPEVGSLRGISMKIFLAGYVAYIILIALLLVRIRGKVFRRVMMSFYGTIVISFMMLVIQMANRNSSFMVATFLYPVIAMFYTMHSNPYDAKLGTVDIRAFDDMIATSYRKKQEFLYMSLYLRGMGEEDAASSEEISALLRKQCVSAFRGALLFSVAKDHMIMTVPLRQNPDYKEKIDMVMGRFNKEYNRLQQDYKIVIGMSMDELSEHNEYVSFINSIHRVIPDNTVHTVNEEDYLRYRRHDRIRHELEDIYRKCDLDDPRVLCYCQPVYNINTGRYDTAEALMRLELDGLGVVPPLEFIPMAEEYSYIHVLTKIILHKVCDQVRKLTDRGYSLSRISVNISAIELKAESFCDDIYDIIDGSGITGDQIAIELTESQSERDFVIMKEKISELKEKGIKIYLDDFGTGYSNMERIMALPFDIIKFDRTMVLASEANERSHQIVESLAKMFADMNYSVLYEGVEQDEEEKMCMDMEASYLQGFKYSKPIPIETLDTYLDKQLS